MLAGGKRRLDGNREAHAQFLHYLGAIRSFISKRVNPNDVDDVVQDVALRMHQRAGADGIDNVEGYLFQVARSVLADNGRRNQARMTSFHDPVENHSLPAEDRLPDRIIEDREELRHMLAALQNLPQRSRQAFTLHRFEDMSYADIAKHMGISVSAVEKNIMRAIRHLATCRTT
ncbi:MAG: sigma-70 family RNA polymerase sigma factor [Novosphingobium sp.]